MLNPKDLRSGNWVIIISGTDSKTNSFFEYKPVALDENCLSFAKICFPINLSPNVLDKCGFRHEFGDWYKSTSAAGTEDNNTFLIYRHATKSWYLNTINLPAQPIYLHQLQNLFHALTHQELNVRLGHFENIDIIGPIDFFTRSRPKQSSVRDML